MSKFTVRTESPDSSPPLITLVEADFWLVEEGDWVKFYNRDDSVPVFAFRRTSGCGSFITRDEAKAE